MGALHAGHISLVERSSRECDCTIVSIFVNPTQFNQVEDLDRYPRPLDADLAMLAGSGCNAVFIPSVQEIYPEGPVTRQRWDFGGLDKGLEGKFRPGHFDGVAQVVHILLALVQPDVLYLGQKDYQQFCIVRKMVALERLPVDVRVCPIAREPDGLAMSSRNMRLSPAERRDANAISKVLFRVRNRTVVPTDYSRDPRLLASKAREELQANTALRLEYLEIVDADSLEPLERWTAGRHALICVAAWVGEVRLIDNVLIAQPA